jgi:V8-like Glu-specific endopeptidase
MGQGALEVVVRMFPAVVRLQAGYRRYGTGFLASFQGRHYIVTACHVLQHRSTAEYDKVTFLYSGTGKRREVPLSEVVDMGGLLQHKDLDVALLPVRELPPDIKVTVFELVSRSVVTNATVSIIHHPNGDIAKVGTCATVMAAEEARVFHPLKTDKGSSGAPVFVAKGGEAHVVAVHCGAEESGEKRNYGAPIGKVVAWLEETLA